MFHKPGVKDAPTGIRRVREQVGDKKNLHAPGR
jgi:hypothetical protein